MVSNTVCDCLYCVLFSEDIHNQVAMLSINVQKYAVLGPGSFGRDDPKFLTCIFQIWLISHTSQLIN